MSSTAIGSASVILAANADGLVAGLDKAERKVNDFAGDVGRKLDKAGGSGGGGLLGKLFGGAKIAAAGGAVAGAVAGGVMKGLEVLSGIPDLIRGLAEKGGENGGALKGIVAAMDRVQAVAERVGGAFFAAIGPGIIAVADVAERLSERFGGLIGKIGGGFGAALTFGVELAGELLTVVGEVAESFIEWATGLAGVSNSAEGMGSVAMNVFRAVAKHAAYVWDTIKAGAGAIGWVAGKIVTGLGHVVESLRNVIDLAKSLPASVRPDWIDGLSAGVERTGRRMQEIGRGMSEWGANAVTGFGDSARRVDEWMDGVESRFASRRSALDGMATTAAAAAPKLGGALQKGSAEAYSVVAKFQTAGAVANDATAIAARKQDETNRLLRDLIRAVAGSAILRTI